MVGGGLVACFQQTDKVRCKGIWQMYLLIKMQSADFEVTERMIFLGGVTHSESTRPYLERGLLLKSWMK